MRYRPLIPAALAVIAMACSVESTATNEASEDPRSMETADPDFYEDARLLLAEMDGPDTDRTDLGVVMAENQDGWDSDWVVLAHARSEDATETGDLVLLEPAINCADDDDTTREGDLWQLLDPGDLIIWTRTGDDTRVCTAEVTIVEKAAVNHDTERQ